MVKFYHYVRSFYGRDGLYPMGATVHDIIAATKILVDADPGNFEGDSMDREDVRDILIKDFGYVWPGHTVSAGEW
jgi:hypothetical protein